jgi:hypothetical protein
MTIKRMLLLLSAMAAFAAFAAPAAQAEVWWTEGGNTESGETLPGAANPTEITGTGQITSTSSSGLVSGPCETHSAGTAWNGSTMGEGAITSFTITTPCATNIPGCEVSTASTSATTVNPMGVTLTTTDTVDITNVTFTNHYQGASCGVAGVPTFVSATGTVTGTLENSETEDGRMSVCVNLNNHTDDLTVENPGSGEHLPITVNLSGRLCIDRTDADITFEHREG